MAFFNNKLAIFFDLDGTLVDSAYDIAAALNHCMQSLNRPTYSLEQVRDWVGNGATVLVQRGLSGQHKVDDDLDPQLLKQALSLFMQYYHQHLCVQTQLYPNVESTLKTLQSQYQLGIITNKPEAMVEPILQSLNIDSYFSAILGGDSLAKKKPNPLPLTTLCQRWQLQPEQVVMVGDSSNDILAAQNANMHSVAVSYGYQQQQDSSLLNPSQIIDDCAELPALFQL